MKLTLALLTEKMSQEYPALQLTDTRYRKISHIAFFSSEKHCMEKTTLYIIADKNQLQRCDTEKISQEYLFFYPQGMEWLHGIAYPTDQELYQMINYLYFWFEKFQQWEKDVMLAVRENGDLSEILNLSAQVTPDTIWVSDPNLKMLGHTSPTLMNAVSAIWRYQVKYNYVPMNVVQKLIESGELQMLSERHRVFTNPRESFNLPYTCRNIFLDGELKAHIFIISIYSQPNRTNWEVADHLGELLLPYIRNHPELSVGSRSFHGGYFRDILEGKLRDVTLIKQQLSYFSWDMNDIFALVLLKAEEEKSTPDVISSLLASCLSKKQIGDCQIFTKQSYVLALIREPDIEKLRKLLEAFAKENQLYVSLSRSFSPLTKLPSQYENTEQLLKMGVSFSPKTYFYCNADYGLYMIMDELLKKHAITEVCHEGVMQLYTIDREKHTEYVETLYAYLSNDRNILRTAKALYIHRNTLNYRLQHIFSYINIPELRPEELHYILLSLYALKYGKYLKRKQVGMHD